MLAGHTRNAVGAFEGPLRSTYRVEQARSIRELDAAARVRWAVFSEAMHLAPELLPALREINGFDVLDTSDNFVCFHGEAAIGTIRLMRPNPEVARVQGLALGLPLELQCRVEGSFVEGLGEGGAVAELGRAAILPAHRGSPAIGRLYRAAYAVSRAHGIDRWLGFSLTETDHRADADLMLAALARRGRVGPSLLHARHPPPPDFVPRRPFYGPETRRVSPDHLPGDVLDDLPLPGIVRFLLGIGLHFVGPPVFEPTFAEYVLPIMLPLDDFARSGFGRRAVGPLTRPAPTLRHAAGPAR